MRVYFDNAATTPLSEEVLQTMITHLRDYGNPSSIHSVGRKSRSVIEKARKSVARYLNSSVGEIFFTSGGTESNNMALRCAVRDLCVTRIITSAVEHHSVLHTVESLGKEGVEIVFVNLDEKGRVDYRHLSNLLANDSQKTLVSLMHANNEIGTLLDLKRVSALCKENEAYFHCDTVQTIAHFPLDLQEIPIDFLVGSAHKYHGPKGSGFIFINGDNKQCPFIEGGAQERNMRAGTENVAGIAGLAKALELAVAEMESRKDHIEEIRSYLMEQLLENFEGISFNGDFAGNYLYTVLSVAVPVTSKTDLLIFNLDIAGVCASGGSACSSGAEKGSHVIAALFPNEKKNVVRFSFSHYNTKEEVDFVVEKLKGIIPVKKAVTA